MTSFPNRDLVDAFTSLDPRVIKARKQQQRWDLESKITQYNTARAFAEAADDAAEEHRLGQLINTLSKEYLALTEESLNELQAEILQTLRRGR